MNALALLTDLRRDGFTVRAKDTNTLVVNPRSRLTGELLHWLRQYKAELLAVLTGEKSSVVISGHAFAYSRRWSGQAMTPADGYLAFDTETDLVDLSNTIPQMALASASASEQASTLIHPDDVGRFILAHKAHRFVCHNAAFDFWVIEQHLRERGEPEARAAWWQIAEEGRLHDSMLLDMLVRLARDDSFPDRRNLAVVAREYAGLLIDKEDPYRHRYGELMGKDWSTIEPGFWDYAIKDAIVTRTAYLVIRKQAERLLADFRGACEDIMSDAVDRFGLLTEAVQVKKAIALSQIQRNGMCVDTVRARQAEAALRQRLREAVANVQELCPGLFKTDRGGNLVCTSKAKAPSKSKKALMEKLTGLVGQIKEETGNEPSIPRTAKSRELSTSVRVWAEYADHDPFLRSWIETEELAKLLQFFPHLQQGRIHLHYRSMVRTGRTSCRDPNVQQIPRDGDIRSAFVPSPGHFLLAVDYSFIELVTLAAHCQHRYGWSDQANTIRAGTDPHAHTAAMMLGVPAGEFLTWKNSAKHAARFKEARQAAKAVNFGVPGGLGARSLAAYAKSTYGVTLTLEEAQERRKKLVEEVYRELDQYLAEDATATLARNLRVPVDKVRGAIGDIHLTCVRKVIAGEAKKPNGEPYSAAFIEKVWNSLLRAAQQDQSLLGRLPRQKQFLQVHPVGVSTGRPMT
jgi:hypothetical protein